MTSRSVLVGPFVILGPMLVLACGAFSADEASGTPSDEASVADGGRTEGSAGEGGFLEAGGGGDGGDGGVVPGTVVLASGFGSLSGITADETTVYFVEQAKGGVHAVPLDGSQKDRLLGPGSSTPRSIVLIGSDLYWCNVTPTTVNKVHVDGNDFASVPLGVSNHRMIALAATSSGIVALGSELTTNVSTVFSFPLPLGTASTGATGFHNSAGIATRSNEVFFSEGSEGIIGHAANVGSAAESFATSESDPGSVAVDSANVYWTRPSGGLVRAKLGSAAPMSIATGQDHPYSIATDGTNVYWMTGDGRLRRASAGGGPITDVQSGFVPVSTGDTSTSLIGAIALTKNYVVWLTGDGNVMRTPK